MPHDDGTPTPPPHRKLRNGLPPSAGAQPPAGPQQGESATGWAEGIRSGPPEPTPPHEYHRANPNLRAALVALLLMAILAFALFAISLSGGIETIGDLQ